MPRPSHRARPVLDARRWCSRASTPVEARELGPARGRAYAGQTRPEAREHVRDSVVEPMERVRAHLLVPQMLEGRFAFASRRASAPASPAAEGGSARSVLGFSIPFTAAGPPSAPPIVPRRRVCAGASGWQCRLPRFSRGDILGSRNMWRPSTSLPALICRRTRHNLPRLSDPSAFSGPGRFAMSPPFPAGGFPPARSALPPRDVDAHTRAVQARARR